jgi:predicted transcriptional regulator
LNNPGSNTTLALRDGVYFPTPEEFEEIDRGLRDAEQGRFATDEAVEQAFAKFHGA